MTDKAKQGDNNNKEDDYEKSYMSILEKVLKVGCATGIVEKKQLPPAICSFKGMKLWCTVLKKNNYNGIQLCLQSISQKNIQGTDHYI